MTEAAGNIRQWWVPGRVTLLGEHLDHNGGPVLAMPIQRGVTVKARPRGDASVHVWTGGEYAVFGSEPGPDEPVWQRFVSATLATLNEAGISPAGTDVVIESDLPQGAGLGSSAAFLVGVVHALAPEANLDVAAIARAAERRSGADVGPLDHAVVASGADSVLMVDCAHEPVTLAPVAADWSEDELALVVIDTGVSHAVGSSEYAIRRAECTAAANAAGVARLAQIDLMGMVGLDDPQIKKRAQHVFTETQRVRGGLKALGAREWTQFGQMMAASHASLRDDFEVSCAELDVAVDASLEAGALGARLVGAGFGGSAIALTSINAMLELRAKVEAAFETRGWAQPTLFSVRPPARRPVALGS